MNHEKIKGYDELNDGEHFILNAFREMKIECDKARFELMTYQISHLIESYGELRQLRDGIRENYFAMMKKIDESEFATIDIDYQKWDIVLTNEKSEWDEEVELISQFKFYLDDLLIQLNEGTIEHKIIDAENLVK